MFHFSIFLFSSYDHLSKVLTRILDERPDDPVDIFESVSSDEKRAKFVSNVDTVQNKNEKSTEIALAEIQQKLFSVSIKIKKKNFHGV